MYWLASQLSYCIIQYQYFLVSLLQGSASFQYQKSFTIGVECYDHFVLMLRKLIYHLSLSVERDRKRSFGEVMAKWSVRESPVVNPNSFRRKAEGQHGPNKKIVINQAVTLNIIHPSHLRAVVVDLIPFRKAYRQYGLHRKFLKSLCFFHSFWMLAQHTRFFV